MNPTLNRRPATLMAGSITLLTLSLTLAPVVHAAEYFVNNASASCSNTGPGTPGAPYCTINAALNAHHEPGVVITVMPGTYREQVTLPASGVADSPITLRGQPGAVVDGTDDYSNPTLWSPFTGDVWLTPSVAFPPVQVFADDQRLSPSTAPPDLLPARSFTFVAGSGLYVNVGGGNPGSHRTQVGARARGIFASGRSFVIIRGFTVTRTEDRCIQLTNSSNILVDGNTLTFSGGIGLQASGDSNDRIVGNRASNNNDHGISLLNGTVDCTVENNEAFENADPTQRRANGIFVGGSSRNVIRGNRWHHNQDSGEQFSPGAADNVSLQNRSWANGDHGYDHNQATGTLHVNDVAYGNLKDGFSVEGSSTGTHLFNCIAIENGVTTNEFDLWVDEASTAGLLSNDNVLWNSGPQPPVKIGTSVYPSVSAYATGRNQDTRSVQSNPMFVNAANGDFHLAPGSPAIDNANSSAADWSSTDAEGNARRDDPGMPNRGLGPVTFADRGALEFLGSTPVVPPVARLTATPASGTAPLAVQLDASASTAAAGRTLVSYRFEYGDGGTSGPQPAATASHTYAAGAWTATVTVTDDLGITATASTAVTVNAAPANLSPVARLTANPATGSAALRVHLSANGSSDPDGAIVSYRFDFGDGTTAGPQSSSQADHTYAAGTWTATVTATDNRGATGTATAGVVVTAAALNLPPLAQLTITPRSGVAPLSVRARGQQSVDPDGKIRSYLFDFGDSTGAEPQKSPEARHTYGAGHWTARLDVTDDRGATSSAFVTVDVSGAPANLAANGEFETGTTGWAAAGGSSISRAPGGQSGGFSLLASAPVLGLAAFGVTNLPDPVQNIAAVGTQYHVRAWVRAESGAGLVNLTMNESDASGASFTSRSSAIVLGTDWLALDLDVTTQLAVSALDLSVVEAPSVVGSAFRVDNVSIVQGTGAPAPVSALTFAEDAAEPAPADVRSLVPGVHPNPMRADGTRIVFTTDAAGPAEVAIFDLAGRLVRRLAGAGYPTKSGPAVARTHFVVFDGRGDDGRRLPGGVYYYQVRAPGTGTRGRLVLIE